MPKKVNNRLTYDVSRVLTEKLPSPTLSPKEKSEVTKSFHPHDPSEKFLENYERAVSFYIWDVNEVQKTTPAKVKKRINGIHNTVKQLLNDLQNLENTDRGLLDRHFISQSLKDRKSISLKNFISHLALFIENSEAAVDILEDVSENGRMPAYAEQGLAFQIGKAIRDETGKLPPLTRNGVFSRVLKSALEIGDKRLERRIGKDRKDVMELMRTARANMDSE